MSGFQFWTLIGVLWALLFSLGWMLSSIYGQLVAIKMQMDELVRLNERKEK